MMFISNVCNEQLAIVCCLYVMNTVGSFLSCLMLQSLRGSKYVFKSKQSLECVQQFIIGGQHISLVSEYVI